MLGDIYCRIRKVISMGDYYWVYDHMTGEDKYLHFSKIKDTPEKKEKEKPVKREKSDTLSLQKCRDCGALDQFVGGSCHNCQGEFWDRIDVPRDEVDRDDTESQ